MKQEDEINKVFKAADEWFTKFSDSQLAHKELKRMLLSSTPAAKKMDYFLDLEGQRVDVVVYVGVFTSLFTNTQRLASNILDILKECLPDYELSVAVKRLKS